MGAPESSDGKLKRQTAADGPSPILSREGPSTMQSAEELPTKPSKKWSLATLTLPPFGRTHEYHVNQSLIEFPTYKHKVVYRETTQPPSTKSMDPHATVFTEAVKMDVRFLKVCMGVMWFALALFVITKLLGIKKRTRRVSGAVLAVRAVASEQHPQTSRRTPFQSAEAGPRSNDFPPSYQECTLYNLNENDGAAPPPYTSPEVQKQRPIKNEHRPRSENVTPELRTQVVFDCSRDYGLPTILLKTVIYYTSLNFNRFNPVDGRFGT